MVYVKTDWVDENTPLDEAHLDKMEQGIYDAHVSISSLESSALQAGMFDAAGDLIIGSGDDAGVRLPKGTPGQVLTTTAVDPFVGWADPDVPDTVASKRLLIPVRLRIPRATTLAGNVVYSVALLTAWDMPSWEFIDAAEGRVYGHVRWPSVLSATAPDPKLTLALAGGAAGNAVIRVRTHLLNPGETLNPGSFSSDLGNVTVPLPTPYLLKEQVLTPTAAAGRTMLVEVIRYGADAADTLAGTLHLLDAYIEVNI